MPRRACLLAVSAALALAAPALANGVIDSSPVGGLQFEQSLDIAIAKEDLFLSLPKIRVHYVYHSDAAETQSVNISFPLAKLGLLDGPGTLDTYYQGREGETDFDPRNYMEFHASVNGTALKPSLREYAWLDWGGEVKDVTAALAAAKVSPFLTAADMKTLEARRNDPAIRKLIADGLISEDSTADGTLYPNWEYQAVYYWPQDFAPGDTVVDIDYVPYAGSPGDYGETYEKGDIADAACVDDNLRKAIARLKAKNNYYEPIPFGYIVDTALYWKGPIGEFTLTVDKGEPSNPGGTRLIAFCPLDAKKTAPTQWTWTAKDFVPEKNIQVILYDFYPPG